MKFSVLMSVYKNTKIGELEECLSSLYNQTVKANEIVIVVDGEIPIELKRFLDGESAIHKEIKLCYREENRGLGLALRYGVENCTYELIARMDTDDICVLDRFEQQLKIFKENPNADIVGGDISEFIGSADNVVSYRNVPTTDKEIKRYLKKRCPFNHVTVTFKKSAVLSAGNYQDFYLNEDYYLWICMAQNNSVMLNTGTVLVNVRVGEDMYKRRGGIKYYKSEKELQKYMLKNKIIGIGTYFSNLLKRFIVQVLLPNKIRGWVFKKFARSNKQKG